MKNNYGNYVIQKALKLSTGLAKTSLINAILKNLDKIGEVKLTLKWQSIVENHVISYYKHLERSLNAGNVEESINSNSTIKLVPQFGQVDCSKNKQFVNRSSNSNVCIDDVEANVMYGASESSCKALGYKSQDRKLHGVQNFKNCKR